jgi:undecaprenyl-diphosphatase
VSVPHLTYPEAIVIGLLQGVTELFPVSSLGHSVLIPALIGGQWASDLSLTADKSPYLAFLVAVHVATAVALVVFFRRDWVRIVVGLLTSLRTRKIETPDQRLAWLLVVATIPVGLGGQVYQAVGYQSGGSGRVSAGHDADSAVESDRRLAGLSWGQAVLIGAAQMLALLPGISRSGSTIGAGLLRGLNHEDAARFAFLLATPVILAAGVLKLPSLAGPQGHGVLGPVVAGSIVAGIAAFFSLKFLTKYFETRTLNPFAVYCVIAGALALAWTVL